MGFLAPRECPQCGEDMAPNHASFTYECPRGHVWKKEQFVYGQTEKPWAIRLSTGYIMELGGVRR